MEAHIAETNSQKLQSALLVTKSDPREAPLTSRVATDYNVADSRHTLHRSPPVKLITPLPDHSPHQAMDAPMTEEQRFTETKTAFINVRCFLIQHQSGINLYIYFS